LATNYEIFFQTKQDKLLLDSITKGIFELITEQNLKNHAQNLDSRMDERKNQEVNTVP